MWKVLVGPSLLWLSKALHGAQTRPLTQYLAVLTEVVPHRQRHRQREKQVPYGKLDVGLDPRTPGSHPRPKAGTKPLSHPGIPSLSSISLSFIKQLN